MRALKSRALGWMVFLFATPVHANPNPALQEAEELLERNDYKGAEKALTQALLARGNDRDALVRILEQQGIVAGSLNQPAKAEAAFRKMLIVDPTHRLGKDYAPRVTGPFHSAEGWLMDQTPLKLRQVEQATVPEVVVLSDPLNLARTIRFHVKGASRAETVVLTAHRARLKGARHALWWAEMLGDREAVLGQLGSEANPLKSAGPTAPPAFVLEPLVPAANDINLEPLVPKKAAGSEIALEPLVPAPSAAPEIALEPLVAKPVSPPPSAGVVPQPAVVATRPSPVMTPLPAAPTLSASSGISPLRWTGYALGGGAVVTAVVGAVLGAQAQSAASDYGKCSTNAAGLVTGCTQVRAYNDNSQVSTKGPVANALFGVSAALAVAGGTLWWMGGRAPPVAVSIGPAGASLSVAWQ